MDGERPPVEDAWLQLPEQPPHAAIHALWDGDRLRLSWGGREEQDLNLRLRGMVPVFAVAFGWAVLTGHRWLAWAVFIGAILFVVLEVARHVERQYSKQLHLLPDMIEFARRPGRWGCMRKPAAKGLCVSRPLLAGGLVVRGPGVRWRLHEIGRADARWLMEVLHRWREADSPGSRSHPANGTGSAAPACGEEASSHSAGPVSGPGANPPPSPPPAD